MISDGEELSALAEAVAGPGPIVALTGAGASAESGVPTYRGAGSAGSRFDPARYASIAAFREDPSYYWSFFKEERYLALAGAAPNAAHRALAALERSGRLAAVVTQNIDGLHQAAGSLRVLELHGNARRFVCDGCSTERGFEEVRSLADVEVPPRCPACGASRLRPGVVMFGEPLDGLVLGAARQAMAEARVVIVVGSSLVVQPAASLPLLALERGGRLAIVNVEPTPLDGLASAVVHAPAGPTLARVLERLGIA